MKKALVITVLFFVFLALCFLQTNLFSWYNIAGIKPNLFIIFILFIDVISMNNAIFFYFDMNVSDVKKINLNFYFN